MEKQLHRLFYEIEDTHWWSVGMRQIQLDFVRRYLIVKNPKILDIGCGTGATLKELSKIGRTLGIDSSKEALSFCRRRGLRNIRLGKATRLPFKDGSFDCMTAFDVIEHIKDHLKTLREIARVLKTGGIAVFTVPAFMFLWDDHDQMNRHYRRYTIKGFTRELDSEKLKIKYISYFNFFLFPMVLAIKFINRFLGRNRVFNNQMTVGPLNSILLIIFLLEKRLLPFFRFPFGVSILCVVEKN